MKRASLALIVIMGLAFLAGTIYPGAEAQQLRKCGRQEYLHRAAASPADTEHVAYGLGAIT